MSLKFVCLSDLHLGAKDSLLSETLNGSSVVAATFAQALRATVKAMSKTPVRLVLLGDVLDLGLSPMGEASSNLINLLSLLFPPEPEGHTPVFEGDIVYIPGNHDHHIWRMAQDERFIDRIEHSPRLDRDILQITPIADSPTIRCRLVTALMQRVPALRGSACHVAYPNWAIWDPSGKRAAVLHHGHFLDPMYMALSRLAQWLELADDPGSAADIERRNGPWIDFIWSDLGSAGRVGESAYTLYETMMDGDASHEFAESLAERVAAMLESRIGIREDSPLPYGLTPEKIVRAAANYAVGSTAQSQRDGYRNVLSRSMIAGLRWYLTNPVARQFRAGCKKLPEEIAFIFGHTHKPFQDQIMVPPYLAPSRIYNTGGWVLDEPTLMPCQGAAAMLIDEKLNVASLRLFNDVTNDEIAPISAKGIGGFSDADNPLLESAGRAIDSNATAWSSFSSEVRTAIKALADQRVQKRIEEMHVEMAEEVA